MIKFRVWIKQRVKEAVCRELEKSVTVNATI
ncbi:hypothetical protein OESDEN_22431 [Oesophagostomum dentatum]|uniref:Uncharacterized protein n=1 Tax=Oesophagostomum dentatum TaxID=61180 RepID=A0A0B1RZ33_OESDE|nr:hypothetical protein OESDEN_22431 [Oesophagostomum dentatum]